MSDQLRQSKHGRATNHGTCRSCQQPILWVRTFKNDKPMPVDPETDESHYSTCPQAANWRRR